jgi:uncharacterized protein YabN with tetrapyrrole methylase and pyrophosphatase domain
MNKMLNAQEIRTAIITNKKIPAIKMYRERTGASLADAKKAVEDEIQRWSDWKKEPIDRPDPPSRQGTLTFQLPEEQNAFEISVKALDFAFAWDDLQDQIRRTTIKYTDMSEEQFKVYEKIQDLIIEISQNRELPGLI